VLTGLKFVSSGSTYLRPWNSRMKSIIGGAIYIGSNYISIGQDTIYYQKYDVIDYYGYIHQYMTHVLAPRSESVNAAKAYSDEMKKNTAIVFKIPVYNNMPEEICAIPTKSGSPNNTLASLNIEGYTATPRFGKFIQEYDLIVENSVSSINVVATPADNKAKVTGDGLNLLKVGNNKFDIVVTAENGDVRTYTINVVRKSSESGNLLYGDINSDNVVDITDCVMMKKHLAGIKVPINLETCDVNADNKIDVADAVKLMKKLAGMDIILGQPD
ncbi:MAG: cadherin-like beta sandwich domain-containing protein, partial [Lachnospira sp.]|nr:cadherin-like beta sandwich domain-containing protein [Lachnospira sp.]